jgi:hypothetical protein
VQAATDAARVQAATDAARVQAATDAARVQAATDAARVQATTRSLWTSSGRRPADRWPAVYTRMRVYACAGRRTGVPPALCAHARICVHGRVWRVGDANASRARETERARRWHLVTRVRLMLERQSAPDAGTS